MKIFLDFDNVVFNTKEFNKERIKIFNGCGIAEEVFNQYFEEYRANRKKGELVQYSQEEHITSLGNMLDDVDFERLRKDLSEFMKDLEKYVFGGFYGFAEKVGKENLCLISYGNIEFQEEKIKNSKVEKYFDEIFITDALKSEIIIGKFKNNDGGILIDGKAYFIDDHVAHLKDVKENIPQIKTLLMIPENGKNTDEQENEFCDGVIKNFIEMEKLLEQDGEL